MPNTKTAHDMDDSPYIEILITLGQLLFTTVECMRPNLDRLAKIIMIIYTIMSILQAVSLIILHKQTKAFSIIADDTLSLLYPKPLGSVTEDEFLYSSGRVIERFLLEGVMVFLVGENTVLLSICVNEMKTLLEYLIPLGKS
ncbi:hypothetical protein F4703DRAFT_1794107 [Phycomyces blakesleeanus]